MTSHPAPHTALHPVPTHNANPPTLTVTRGDSGFVHQVACGKRVVVDRQWGIETADGRSFFGAPRGGFRYDLRHAEVQQTDEVTTIRYQVDMAEGGCWLIAGEERHAGSCLTRSYTVTAERDTWLMDFVLRQLFVGAAGSTATIVGRRFDFVRSNLYRQYPTPEVALDYADGLQVSVRTTVTGLPAGLGLFMYARDNSVEGWVIHARLLPVAWHREVIKLNRSWYNRAIPDAIARPVLSVPPLRSCLWYLGERRMPRFPFSAYPLVQLPAGTTFQFGVTVAFAYR